MKTKIISILVLSFTATVLFAQDASKSFRVNFINPGCEWDIPISKKSIVAINPGVGWNTSYVSSRFFDGDDGLTTFISPFVDIAYMNLYSLKKRFEKGKKTAHNSANYLGARFITKFEDFDVGHNDRETDLDFSISPTWGMRRNLGKLHSTVEFRPTVYFDDKGNVDFYPLIIHLKLGFNIK